MFKIYSKDETMVTESLMAVIYGTPGIGKTSLAFTSLNPVLLDFDKGVQRAIGKKIAIRVETWDDVQKLQSSAEFAALEVGTLILDTGGTMLDNYIADYVKRIDPKNARRGGELSLQGYGAMKTVFKQFKDWTQSQNVNIIFVCHAKDESETDAKKKIPAVTGGSLDLLRQSSDLIGYMYSSMNKRVIDFSPNIDTHEGKDCANIGLVEIPDATQPEYETLMGDLIERTLARMNEISEKQKEMEITVSEYMEKIDKVKAATGANKLITALKEEEKFVQVKCFNALKLHCTTKQIAEYSSEGKKFLKLEDVKS